MRKSLAILAVAVGAGLPARADEPRPAQKASPEAAATQAKSAADAVQESKFWMDQKLQKSQAILAGLTRNDFDAIDDNAKQLNVLNYLEAYVRADVPEYKEQLQVFKFANGSLIKASRNRDTNGATLAYTQLVVSCVNCHNVVRDTKPAR